MEISKTSLIRDAYLRAYTELDISAFTINGSITVDAASGKFGTGASATWSATNYLSKNISVNVGTGDFSFGCWMKKTSPPTNDYTPTIMTIGSSNPRAYLIASKTTGYVLFNTFDGSSISATSTVNICDNVWHSVIGVRSGTTQTIYADGVSVGTASGTAKNISTNIVSIGTVRDVSFDNLGAAFIDEGFIFSRALTQSEITLIATSKSSINLKQYRRTRTPGAIEGL